jgi:hypothetical protein
MTFGRMCGCSTEKVRANCCVSVLPPSTTAPPYVAYRARDADRVKSRVAIEPPVLDGDDRVLIRAMCRHIAPLLVESEPGPTVGAVKHRVADTARGRCGKRVTARPRTAASDPSADERQREPVRYAAAWSSSSQVSFVQQLLAASATVACVFCFGHRNAATRSPR